MIKNDIAKTISNKLNITTKESAKLTEDMINYIKEILETKQKLVLSGFGRFKVLNKASRIGRNPKNKKEYEISARKTVKFYPSKIVKNILNKKKHV